MAWQKIELRTNEYANPDGSVRAVDQVEVWGFGQCFRRDIRSDTDLLLVGKMAEAMGLEVTDYRRKPDDARRDNMDIFEGKTT